jgi:hypothetical protein
MGRAEDLRRRELLMLRNLVAAIDAIALAAEAATMKFPDGHADPKAPWRAT